MPFYNIKWHNGTLSAPGWPARTCPGSAIMCVAQCRCAGSRANLRANYVRIERQRKAIQGKKANPTPNAMEVIASCLGLTIYELWQKVQQLPRHVTWSSEGWDFAFDLFERVGADTRQCHAPPIPLVEGD